MEGELEPLLVAFAWEEEHYEKKEGRIEEVGSFYYVGEVTGFNIPCSASQRPSFGHRGHGVL